MADKITAGMVAAELRKLADALDKEPDAPSTEAHVYFSCYSKEDFLTAAKVMPKPFVKSREYESSSRPDLSLKHTGAAMNVQATIAASLTCTLVEPAKPAVYKCDPILSAIEEAALEGAA